LNTRSLDRFLKLRDGFSDGVQACLQDCLGVIQATVLIKFPDIVGKEIQQEFRIKLPYLLVQFIIHVGPDLFNQRLFFFLAEFNHRRGYFTGKSK